MKSKKILLIAAVAVILLAAFAAAFHFLQPETNLGAKTYTLEVVDNEGKSTHYIGRTDQQYLRAALDELEGFNITGEESQYGLYIQEVNGLKADYQADGAYWAIYVNGEYGTYSVDEQPVTDGDAYSLVYEKSGS